MQKPKQKNGEEKYQEVPRKGVSWLLFIPTLVLLMCVSFVAGTRSDELTQYVSLPFIETKQQQLDVSSLQTTYETLKKRYDGSLNSEKLIEGANRGLVEAAGDDYTVFFNKKEAQEFSDDLEGTFEGIGAELTKRDGNLKIVTTLDGSPAKKAGLQSGDVIAKVNGQDTTSWSIDKAVSQIRGKKGTTVKLTVIRGESEVKELNITRDTITDPSVKSEIKDGVGIMRISRFGSTDTMLLAQKAAQEFKDKKVKGVIVDVRGNGGGYVSAAQELAGLWLDNQTVVSERRGGEMVDSLKTGSDPILKGIPTIVLIDQGSASASEILAGALSDHEAAKLVGEQTFGKGSVQELINLPNGARLKVTTARWYTPNGKNIGKNGISPDVKVTVSEQDNKNNKDPQLQKALELLEK